LVRHNGIDGQILDSDLDRLNGVTNDGNRLADGPILSLLLEFSLESGQYETMFIREILKRSTEIGFDSALSWWCSTCTMV
jgi:tRNA(Glu) U13 pseudouridine synthase TruD